VDCCIAKIQVMEPLHAGDVAIVVYGFTPNAECGYLTVSEGECVEILYVGEKEDELGWLFARSCQTKGEGWLPQDNLQMEEAPPVPATRTRPMDASSWQARRGTFLDGTCSKQSCGEQTCCPIEAA